MTKPFKPILIVLLAIMLASCGAIRESLDAARPVNLSVLKLGMSKDEVQQYLNKKPDNTIAAKNYPDTKTFIEVVQYSQQYYQNGDTNRPVSDAYWLYFVNDKLDKWEKANSHHTPWI
ncbi:hypothetical protein [Mucilaginibacter sp. NFX135]|uniref:hypothetical protein n=1 Tax=Mucilaginibacter sp. NFX135 TaxID=3402687 RepID=UPI003AFA8F5E